MCFKSLDEEKVMEEGGGTGVLTDRAKWHGDRLSLAVLVFSATCSAALLLCYLAPKSKPVIVRRSGLR